MERVVLDMQFMKIESLLATFDEHLWGSVVVMPPPRVSICLITYNHEEYLETTLNSIFEQHTDFDFEVVIGDDYSTDCTPNIIKNFAKKYPNQIRAYLHPYNLSKEFKEYPPAKLNFLHALYQTRGQYVLHIEGDDYFCDTQKLQKQVDYLETNLNSSACFHNAKIIYEDNSGREEELLNSVETPKFITTKDLILDAETWFMATASVMFRRGLVLPFPDWFWYCKSGDIPLYFLLSQKGSIFYMQDVMSIYRKNLGGMSFTDSNQDADFIENRIFMYSNMNRETKYTFDSTFKAILAKYYLSLCQTKQYKTLFFKKLYITLKSYWYVRPTSWEQLTIHFRDYVVTDLLTGLYFFLKTGKIR